MATHSSVLARRIPATGEPGGLPSLGLHRVWHDWSDLAAAAAGSFSNESQREIRLRRWSSGKESACQCKRQRRWKFYPWVATIPWRRAWQSTPVFLLGKSHRQRSLVVCISVGSQRGQTWQNTQREIVLLKSKYKYFKITYFMWFNYIPNSF